MKETDFARYLTQFLAVYLPGQRGMKRNSQISYRDAFSLVLELSGTTQSKNCCQHTLKVIKNLVNMQLSGKLRREWTQ